MSRHASTPAALLALALCGLASAMHFNELEHAALSAGDFGDDDKLARRVQDVEFELRDWSHQHGTDIDELRDDTKKGLEDISKKLQQEGEERKEAQDGLANRVAKVETELKEKNELILTLLNRMKGSDKRVQQLDERVRDMSTDLNTLRDNKGNGNGAVVQRLGELEKKIDQDRAEKAMKEAIASKDMSALRVAIQQAKILDLDVSLAEAIVKKDEARKLTKEALAAKDLAKLEAALAAAKGAGLGRNEWEKVETAIGAIKQKSAEKALEEAIASKDMSALRSAIQQAKILDLDVSHAEAILEARELAKQALAAKDLAELEAALAAAKGAGLRQDERESVERAISAVKQKQEQDGAEKALMDAIALKDVSALRSAIQQAKSLGLDVSHAEAILKKEEAREFTKEALEAKDIPKLEAALEAAKGAGLARDEWKQVENAIWAIKQKQEQDRAEKALKEAIASKDMSALRSAIQQAKTLDLDVSNAEAILETRELTKQALAAKDLAKLEEALAAAKRAGLGRDELENVQNAMGAVEKERKAAADSMRQAAKDGNATRLRSLLEEFPELKDEGDSKWGETSAYLAAYHGHVGALKVLVEAKADVNNAEKTCGATPAYVASFDGRTEALRVLVQARADVNKATSTDGATPAHVAAQEGRAEALQVLVAARADLKKALNDGRTPARIAIKRGHRDVLEVLRGAGVVRKGFFGYSE